MLCVIPEDRSKDAWIAAAWKQEWEASGPTRVHPRRIYVKGEDLSRKHWTTLIKQTANWGQSVQSIHEEVGTGAQCSV